MNKHGRLQVNINGTWQYVFCRNSLKNAPITTTDKRKALPSTALEYFQTHFANHEFRIKTPQPTTPSHVAGQKQGE